MRVRPYRRKTLLHQSARIFVAAFVLWNLFEVIWTRNALIREASREPPLLGKEKIFITSIHWNNELILRTYWTGALLELVQEIGAQNVFVSVQESGSIDNTKGALRELDVLLEEVGVPRRIILDNTTHLDEIRKPPAQNGWIRTPRGETELRRIPYLARLRNLVLEPLYEAERQGTRYDKILFLNDVVFNTRDVRNLLATRNGEYAAACSLDFSKPPIAYDTFALRDIEGHEQVMLTWPYFRARRSRRALTASLPVPVTSCWNGMVAMDAAPFYASENQLAFRGTPDGLAEYHLEGSECCLIHADNPLSRTRGVWLNPNVRVGYNASAYDKVTRDSPWVSTFQLTYGKWANRMLRWTTTSSAKEKLVARRVDEWRSLSVENNEPGPFCLIDEMQILTWNGWAHV